MSRLENVKLYKKPSSRDDNVVWNADDQKLFDKYFDLSERLRQAGGELDLGKFNELADEMDEYCLSSMQPTRKFKESLKARLELVNDELDLLEKFEYIDDDHTLLNVKHDLQERIENIVDINIDLQFKDVIKHDDAYFFWDNVLDQWKIRTTQRYGMSNLQKDPFKSQKEIPNRYKKRMSGKVEKIKRQPITREYSPAEWLDLRNNERVNENIDQVIENTKLKRMPAPMKAQLLSDQEIKSERWTDERRVEYYRMLWKAENEIQVERNESYEREF